MNKTLDQYGDEVSSWAAQVGGVALLIIVLAALLVWFAVAIVAFLVAPEDRPWHFFWCTLLLFGPLGIALALVAPARPIVDDDV